MPKEKRPRRQLGFHRIPLTMQVIGKLHATSAPTEELLRKLAPSESQILKREEQGEPITPIPELAEQIAEDIPEEAEVGKAVFRKHNGIPYIPGHWIKGHLKEGGENLSRTLDFWGLKDFVGRTLYVTPHRCNLEGLEVKSETWPTYFDIPRLGRRSGFRNAEYVENPLLSWNLWLIGDPRWDKELLIDLLRYGSMHGIGGSRGLDKGKYSFGLGDWISFPSEDGWQRYFQELKGEE